MMAIASNRFGITVNGTDRTSKVRRISGLNQSKNVGKANVGGSNEPLVVVGANSYGTITLEVLVETGSGSFLKELQDWFSETNQAARAVSIGIPDLSTTGSHTWTFNAFITGLNIPEANAEGSEVQFAEVSLEVESGFTPAVVA